MKYFNFISNWVLLLFIIWLSLYILYPKNNYLKHFNLYYLNLFIFYGFIGYLLFHLLILKNKFYINYTIINIIIHYLPVYIYQKLNIHSNKYSLKLFIIIFMIYLFYIHFFMNTNMINIYFKDDQLFQL